MQFRDRPNPVNTRAVVGLLAVIGLAVTPFPPGGEVRAAPPEGIVEAATRVASEDSPAQFEWHRGSATKLVFAPDGKSLVMGWQWPPTAFVWDLTKNKVRHLLPWHESGVRAVAYSPDGRLVATGCGPELPSEKGAKREPGKMRFWDPASGKLVREIEAHQGVINALAFSPDGKRLLSGGWDDTARLWDVASGKEVRQFVLDSRTDHVTAVVFIDEGKKAAVGSEKGEVVVVEVESGRSESWVRAGSSPWFLSFARGHGDAPRRNDGG